jgi:hypothetical protein
MVLALGACFVLSAAQASAQCVGDCDGNGTVAINELIRGVNINLGNADISTCTAMDQNGNGSVEINELIRAVNNNLRGCDFVEPTPTATPLVFDSTCSLDEDTSELRLVLAALPVLAFPVGDIGVRCEDFGGDDLVCTCELQQFDAVNIPGLGDVCLEPFAGCPERVADCNGDTGIDADLIADRNIGSCTGFNDCETKCDAYCDGLGANYFRQTSTCEDFCIGGSNDGNSCTVDTDCPDGSCGGPDGGVEGEICNCNCVETGRGSGTAGGVSCSLGIEITVEQDEDGVCGNFPPILSLAPLCGELTTGTSTGLSRNANNVSGATLPAGGSPSELTGVAGSCDDLRAGSVSGATMVGHLGFFGSTVGDILTEITFPCK